MFEELHVNDLHMFQRDCLRVVSHNEPCKGTAIKEKLTNEYGSQVSHSRLYTSLNQMVQMGLIDKGTLDGRTNQYTLSEKGERAAEHFRDAWDDAA